MKWLKHLLRKLLGLKTDSGTTKPAREKTMNNRSMKLALFNLNVTRRLTNKHTGEVLSISRVSNAVLDTTYEATMHAMATGEFSPGIATGQSRHVNRIYFFLDGASNAGNKPSDDTVGVDLIDGGDASKGSAKWTSYIEPESTVTVTMLTLGRIWGDDTPPNIGYASVSDGQEVTNEQRYTIEWEISIAKLFVETIGAENITSSAADLSGGAVRLIDEDITERGFVIDTASQDNPGNVAPAQTAYGTVIDEVGTYGSGIYDLNAGSLIADTQYFVRAFAKINGIYVYGNEIDFTTLA